IHGAVRCAGAVLPGPPDPRCAVPADPAGRGPSSLRPAPAGGAAETVRRDPSARNPHRGRIPNGLGGSPAGSAFGGHDARAGPETCPQPGPALPRERGGLLPLHHHAGHRGDQQPGGTGHPLRGHRPANHARHAERNGTPLVRTHLDGDCHLRPTWPIGLSVSSGFSSIALPRRCATFSSAVRALTALSSNPLLRDLRGSVLIPCHPVNAYEIGSRSRGLGIGIGGFEQFGYQGGMARVFTRREVDAMIEAAVAKATAALRERIATLEAERAEAKKNSWNSSKPPSSDLVKPKKPPHQGGEKRKRGGQPGHGGRPRCPLPPQAAGKVGRCTLRGCPALRG